MKIRYSPNNAADYPGAVGMVVRTDEAWNLAFLSHDYSKGRPMDPNFGVHVNHTLKVRMDTLELDLTLDHTSHLTLALWLRQPAPMFARVLQHLPVQALRALPLYQAQGPKWLDMVQRRSRLYREPFDPVHDAELIHQTEAEEIIQRIRSM